MDNHNMGSFSSMTSSSFLKSGRFATPTWTWRINHSGSVSVGASSEPLFICRIKTEPGDGTVEYGYVMLSSRGLGRIGSTTGLYNALTHTCTVCCGMLLNIVIVWGHVSAYIYIFLNIFPYFSYLFLIIIIVFCSYIKIFMEFVLFL